MQRLPRCQGIVEVGVRRRQIDVQQLGEVMPQAAYIGNRDHVARKLLLQIEVELVDVGRLGVRCADGLEGAGNAWSDGGRQRRIERCRKRVGLVVDREGGAVEKNGEGRIIRKIGDAIAAAQNGSRTQRRRKAKPRRHIGVIRGDVARV